MIMVLLNEINHNKNARHIPNKVNVNFTIDPLQSLQSFKHSIKSIIGALLTTSAISSAQVHPASKIS